MKVSKALRHPHYDESLPINEGISRPPHDLALLTLSERAPTDYVPAQIPNVDIALPDRFLIAGFGVSASRHFVDTGTLRTATVGLKRQMSARSTFETLGGTFADPVGGCAGDSGAPLFQAGNVVFGVLSTGGEIAGKCVGTNVFTDVRAYQSWLKDSIEPVGENVLVWSQNRDTGSVSFAIAMFKKSVTEMNDRLVVAFSGGPGTKATHQKCKLVVSSQFDGSNASESSLRLVHRKWESSEFQFPSQGGIRFEIPGLNRVPKAYSMGLEFNCDGLALTVTPSLFVL